MTEVEKVRAGEPGVQQVQLLVTGMFCGACARRIENKLNKLHGVHALVDFDTSVATIATSGDIDVVDLCGAVEKAGYGAEPYSEGADARVVSRPPRRLIAPAMMVVQMMKARRPR